MMIAPALTVSTPRLRRVPEVHALGCCAHGALVALHALGVVYNWGRRHRLETALHLFAIGCSLYAVRVHLTTED